MRRPKRVYVTVKAAPNEAVSVTDEDWNVLQRGASVTIWGASRIINTKGEGQGVSYSVHTEAALTVYDKDGKELASL